MISHVPAATVLAVEPPDTAHTDGVPELNDTGNPDDADADRVTGTPAVTGSGCANVIVCATGGVETGFT